MEELGRHGIEREGGGEGEGRAHLRTVGRDREGEESEEENLTPVYNHIYTCRHLSG